MNETQTTVRGTIITDPTNRRVGDTPIHTFRVASNSRYQDRSTGEWRTGGTLYLGVTLWGRLAEQANCFTKGDAVLVQGRLSTNEYEKDGSLRSDLEMRATAIGPDLSRMTVTGLSRRPVVESVVDRSTRGAEEGAVAGPDGLSDDASGESEPGQGAATVTPLVAAGSTRGGSSIPF